ncbi:hypothetical protein GCM10022288_12580 [Gryllotalpicola kribbensis]|uniref:Uncharacterized protein n=1 Tax=Gryllotalpicola kribbensis TaxID=993084 RepID=A0ABP8APL0_9MICO
MPPADNCASHAGRRRRPGAQNPEAPGEGQPAALRRHRDFRLLLGGQTTRGCYPVLHSRNALTTP